MALLPIIGVMKIRTYLGFCLQNIVVCIGGISVGGWKRPEKREEKGGRRSRKEDGGVRDNW
jgi:hypothetical protein